MSNQPGRVARKKGKFYYHTALLNAEGNCYGWICKEQARQIRYHNCQMRPPLPNLQFKQRPALQLPLLANPTGYKDRCIFTNSRKFSLHHVIPESGMETIRLVHDFDPFHYMVLIDCEVHDQLEAVLQPLYANDITRVTAAVPGGNWKWLRDRISLIRTKSFGRLEDIPANQLGRLLKEQGWDSVTDIPVSDGKTDPLIKGLNAQKEQAKQDFDARIDVARKNYWLDFASSHTFGEISRMFTEPILALKPQFLDPRTAAYWDKCNRERDLTRANHLECCIS